KSPYNPGGGSSLTDPHKSEVWRRYATVLAYACASKPMINAFVWHGTKQIESDALSIAKAALSNWKNTWGPAPASPADIALPTTIGQGAASYGPGKPWPPHNDHMHIRLETTIGRSGASSRSARGAEGGGWWGRSPGEIEARPVPTEDLPASALKWSGATDDQL